MKELTVGEVSRVAHVSVRTLHHYDAIGLLVPSGRTQAGYRLYSAADLERLRQIRLYRELDFGLDEIADILDGANTSATDHLRRQHRLLTERVARDEALLSAVETEMEARNMGISLTPEEQFEIFGDAPLDEYAEEAGSRWGDTAAWKESQRRTRRYTKSDWLEINAEADANTGAFAAAFRAGQAVDGTTAMDLAEAHRMHITRWFYDCDYGIHRGLGEMYVADARFAAVFDQVEPGLAVYVRNAICANADRAEGQRPEVG